MSDFTMHLVGAAASMMAFVMFVPQALRVWRLRKDPAAMVGVSVAGQIMLVGNAVLWGVYGWMTGAFWVAAPGIVNLPLALVTIGLLLTSRRVSRVQELQ